MSLGTEICDKISVGLAEIILAWHWGDTACSVSCKLMGLCHVWYRIFVMLE
jgi:hypothetical protein